MTFILGFGDSVPAGGGGCHTNFVTEYANLVHQFSGSAPTVYNKSVSGSTSHLLVSQCDNKEIQLLIQQATVILIMTGANDYNSAFGQARRTGDCSIYLPIAAQLQQNVTESLQMISKLNTTAQIVVLGYWASMEDGAVAVKNYDTTAMAASLACTASTNTALSVATFAHRNVSYLNTGAVFQQNTRDSNTDLLQPDGDHPNVKGHQVIAQAIYDLLDTPGGG